MLPHTLLKITISVNHSRHRLVHLDPHHSWSVHVTIVIILTTLHQSLSYPHLPHHHTTYRSNPFHPNLLPSPLPHFLPFPRHPVRPILYHSPDLIHNFPNPPLNPNPDHQHRLRNLQRQLNLPLLSRLTLHPPHNTLLHHFIKLDQGMAIMVMEHCYFHLDFCFNYLHPNLLLPPPHLLKLPLFDHLVL